MSTLNTILSDEDMDDDTVVQEPQEAIEEKQPEAEALEVAEPVDVVDAEEPAQIETPEPRTVPLQALQEERQKRQELEQRMSRLEQEKQPEPEPIPDLLEDPEGYQKWHQRQIRNTQLDTFEESARDVHGDEVVNDAFNAFKKIDGSPEAAAILAVKNPWRAMVKWHKARSAAENFDPVAERAKIKAELMAEMQSERPAVPPPPPSLAKASNLGDRTAREIDESALSLDDILGHPAA